MKFFCERCKTRYSIGDDRVRGKILKIRCKNCANVITVREGMTVDDDAMPRGRSTTMAPMPSEQAPAERPPDALEEEWYVSIDGAQSGPYPLAEAQRWVAEKPHDADLHCWNEGFDDWLPVDRVSHFRGLRKTPLATPPPAPMPSRPPPPRPPPAPMGARPGAPPLVAPLATPVPAAPFAPPVSAAPLATPVPAAPLPPPVSAAPPLPSLRSPRPSSLPSFNGGAGKDLGLGGLGSPPTAAHAPRPLQPDAFDTPPDPPSALGGSDPFADLRTPLPAAGASPTPDPEDDLNIGEVSRVVNLADLARSATGNLPKVATAATMRPYGASVPAGSPLGPGSPLGSGGPNGAGAPATGPIARPFARPPTAQSTLDATQSIEALPPVPDQLAPAPIAQSQRRGLFLLVGAAAAVLVGVTVALVLTLGHDDSDDGDGDAIQPVAHAIDTARPDEAPRDHVVAPPVPEGSAQPHPGVRHPQQITVPQPPQPHVDTPALEKLKPEEIEKMAQDNATGTTRCYMRAQRGVDGIELGDVKKIMVTLTVDKTGVVTDVRLSDHATDTLGLCLTGQIKRWKFRETAGGGGPFQFALAFAGS